MLFPVDCSVPQWSAIRDQSALCSVRKEISELVDRDCVKSHLYADDAHNGISTRGQSSVRCSVYEVVCQSVSLSVCKVWYLTTSRASARHWPPVLAVLCYVQLTQTAGTMVLHDQLWTAFLRFFWSDYLEWHAGSSAQPGLTSKWP